MNRFSQEFAGIVQPAFHVLILLMRTWTLLSGVVVNIERADLVGNGLELGNQALKLLFKGSIHASTLSIPHAIVTISRNMPDTNDRQYVPFRFRNKIVPFSDQ